MPQLLADMNALRGADLLKLVLHLVVVHHFCDLVLSVEFSKNVVFYSFVCHMSICQSVSGLILSYYNKLTVFNK